MDNETKLTPSELAQRVAKLRELWNQANHGEWRADWKDTNHFEVVNVTDGGPYWIIADGIEDGPTLDFVAQSHNDFPALLDALEALQFDNAVLTGTHDRYSLVRRMDTRGWQWHDHDLQEYGKWNSSSAEAIADLHAYIERGEAE